MSQYSSIRQCEVLINISLVDWIEILEIPLGPSLEKREAVVLPLACRLWDCLLGCPLCFHRNDFNPIRLSEAAGKFFAAAAALADKSGNVARCKTNGLSAGVDLDRCTLRYDL